MFGLAWLVQRLALQWAESHVFEQLPWQHCVICQGIVKVELLEWYRKNKLAR